MLLVRRKIAENSDIKDICVHSIELERFVKSDSGKSCLPVNKKKEVS